MRNQSCALIARTRNGFARRRREPLGKSKVYLPSPHVRHSILSLTLCFLVLLHAQCRLQPSPSPSASLCQSLGPTSPTPFGPFVELPPPETSASPAVSRATTAVGVQCGPPGDYRPDPPSCQTSPSEAHRENDKYFLDYIQSVRFFEQHDAHFDCDLKSKNVKGRLKKSSGFWKEIGANNEILDIITNGYKIPFIQFPTPSVSCNNKSAKDNLDFVSSAVEELLTNHCVLETPFIPTVVNPLSVSINKSGKKRLILDLRKVNSFLWKEKITFEDWKLGLDYFKKDSFCFKFDLSKGYHHIDICPQHQQFLGFSINGKFYCFTVLPFGLSSAGFCFTKVLREMVKLWRYTGIKIIMFLDDGFGTSSCFQQASAESDFVRNSLFHAGFVVNEEKSIWVPVQSIEWIGFVWNSLDYRLAVTERRVKDLLESLRSIKSSLPLVSARSLAQCTGKLISMMPVVGNVARLMTRFLYREIVSRSSWDRLYRVPEGSLCVS